ncbi:MAG: hypothetical protein IMY71_03025 [Bacteroidetes bacterium]|nr:hypothetical protein [Bacteroidota bacterium]
MKIPCLLVIVLIIISCSINKDWTKIESTIEEGLHDIEIVDENVAFTYGYGTGNIYKTTNGGKNWKNIYQFDSLYFEQIQFFDEKTGWIAGSPNKLFKTENGGKNWIDKSIKNELENALIYGMYFQDSRNGYISIIRINDNGFISNIYGTNDGGENWLLVNSINEMILNLEEIDNSIFGTGNNVIIKDIHKKNDWKYNFRDTTNQVGQIRDIEINEVGKVIAVSFNGYVIEQNSENWNSIRITKNRIRSLISIDNENWIAMGDSNKESGNLFISTDNSNNWAKIQREFPDIHRINKFKKRLWAAGKEGLIITRRK